MERLIAAALAAALLATPAVAQAPFDLASSAERVKGHMAFLASDLLEGRQPGEKGYDIAANYVASQFAQLGLKPAGDNGTWFQSVPLTAFRAVDEGAYVWTGRDGQATPLEFGEDVMVGREPGPAERKVAAPVVFVGFGLVAPEKERDDYKGLDVKGKIVVALSGAPSGFQTEERAYYADSSNKRAAAQARGAVGFISLSTPADEKRRAFSESKRTWQSWGMTWMAKDGTPFNAAPRTPGLGRISVAGATKLFAGAPKSYAEVAAIAAAPAGDPPRFALPGKLDVTLRSESRTLSSPNVAGMLPGSDPALADEVIVLSAHLDHIGVTPPVNGDTINNGALDNSAGIATTLEVARAFAMSGQAPKRPILFLAVTAEEKGLLGAEYFAQNPTVPAGHLAANVNLDMPILTYDFTDVVAFGADRSTIGPAVRRAAGRLGVPLSPDPTPEEGLFTRSDHFRFVEAGVPAIFLATGYGGPGAEAWKGFLRDCYHKPCDDLGQKIDYRAGARFAQINYEIARELADGAERPRWNAGDFFGGKFAAKP